MSSDQRDPWFFILLISLIFQRCNFINVIFWFCNETYVCAVAKPKMTKTLGKNEESYVRLWALSYFIIIIIFLNFCGVNRINDASLWSRDFFLNFFVVFIYRWTLNSYYICISCKIVLLIQHKSTAIDVDSHQTKSKVYFIETKILMKTHTNSSHVSRI